MKAALFISVFVFIADVLTAQVTKGQYGVKSGHVEYKISGNTTGTKTLWWDNYGARSYTEENSTSVIEMMGIKNETKRHSISVIDGDKYWLADLINNTGQEGSISSLMGTDGANMNVGDLQQFGQQMIDSMGAERRGFEKVLGYDCEVIYWGGSTGWNYQGIILKSRVELMGAIVNEDAVSFEKEVVMPESLLIKKQGIEYTNNDEYMKMLDQYMQDSGSEEGE